MVNLIRVITKNFQIFFVLIFTTNFIYGQNIYWSQSSANQIARTAIPGSPPTSSLTQLTTSNVSNPGQIFVDRVNGFVYYMDGNTTNGGIYRFSTSASFPTSSVTTIVSTWSTTNTGGFTVDVANNTIYWVVQNSSAPDGNTTGDQIRKADLSSIPLNPTTGGTAIVTGGDIIGNLAIDYNNGFLYWTDRGASGFVANVSPPTYGRKVYRVNTNSTTTYNAATVVGVSGNANLVSNQLDNPRDLFIDPVRNYLYWGDYSTTAGLPNIYRISLSASFPATGTAVTSGIITNATNTPLSMAFDYVNNYLYYGDNTSGNTDIKRIDLSNSLPISSATTIADVTTSAGNQIRGLMLDQNTYLQTTSTIWNGSTWSNGNPSSTIDAIIASSTAPSSFTCKALTINSGVALTTTGITATVNGNITNSGNGIAGTGGLTIAANSTLSGNAISFNGALTVNSGATLTTGGLLTLASNATNTARVANSAGVIDGTVAVQRYIPGKRAYRFLTAPLSSNGLSAVNVSNSWQLNTHIVGPTGTGLDAVKPMYSMLTYASGAWQNVTNTTTSPLFNSTATASNRAFALFVTGDRTISLNSTTAFNNTTLSSTGKLLQGTQSISLGNQAANSYHFIGNPYASPVDLNQVFLNAGTSNINRTFYTWDPNLSTTGGYVTISWNGSSYTITPSSGSTSQTQILQSGQAFFVQATSTNTTTVVFEENDKSTTNINNVFGIGNGNTDNLNINLQRIENGNLSTRDGVTASFGAIYNKGINFSEDAEKLFNNEEGITIKRGTTNLSIERRPYITNTNDTIFLALNRLEPNTNYALNINPQNFDAGMQAFLVDKLLSTETAINLQAASQDITITSSVATVADRWMIVFRGTGNLPNNKLSLVATKKDKDVQLTWNIANEQGVKEYELQRSVNGTEFTTINNQVASNKAEYNNVDTKANNGINYYRVKMTMLNDDVRYSNVVTINLKLSTVNPVTVYPNPIKGSIAQLHLNELAAGNYTIRLMDMQGKLVQTQNIQHQGGTTSRSLGLGNVAAGNYQLVVEGKGFTHTISVIKSN